MPLNRQSLALRGAVALALTASLAVLARALLQSPSTGIDDADIFLVYARHVSAGQGFVFNAGGERVEGFTSLLWVLVCSMAVSVTRHPESILLILSVLLLSATVAVCLGSVVVRHEIRARAVSWPWAGLLLILLLSDQRFVAWNTVTLMDTSLWCFLTTTSAALLLRDDDALLSPHALVALSVMLVLARPEALFWVPLLALIVFIRFAVTRGIADGLRRAAPIIGAYLAGEVLLTISRLFYFGFPLPNTYYAKVSPSFSFRFTEGWGYLISYVTSGPVAALATLGVCASWIHVARRGVRREPIAMTLCLLASAGLLLPLITGGDHFGGFRFYQPLFPILVLTFINTARFVVPGYLRAIPFGTGNRLLRVGAAAALCSLFLGYQALEWSGLPGNTKLNVEFSIASAGRRRGAEADGVFGNLTSRPRIASVTVGGFQYAYSGSIVDLMGLNNVRMAHNGGTRLGVRSHAAFEKATFYELQPQILVPLMQVENTLAALQRRNGFVDVVLKGLLDDVEFQRCYTLAEVRAKDAPTRHLAGYYDRNFLATLERSGAFNITRAPAEE